METTAEFLPDLLGDLAHMLRPAGGGVYTVSTGREEQQALQMRLYGAATAAEVETRWRASLAAIPRARVVVLGVPSDVGAGLIRGANLAPQALRQMILELVPDFPRRAAEQGVLDVGDVFVVPQLLHDDMLSAGQLAASRAALYPGLPGETAARLPVAPLSIAERVISLVLQLNPTVKILVLGGDHSVAWPVVKALAAHARRPFAIVQPDAHTDLLAERLGVPICFATWAYHANELLGRQGRLVQVGTRASGKPKDHWEDTLEVKQFWASEVKARGPAAILAELDEHLTARGLADVYLSNDIDATDVFLAPSTGAPSADGLSVEFVRELIQHLGRTRNVIGGDLVEVAPPVGSAEESRRTVVVGAKYVLDTIDALTGTAAFRVT